jgi:hypothetical protein
MRCRLCIGCLCAAVLSGCATSPPEDNPPLVSLYSFSDRGRTDFEEVVLSLRFRGADAPYQNLHVGLTAFVNPTRNASTVGAERIAQSLESRVAARLVELLSGSGEQSIEETPRLRETIRAEAQAVLDVAMKQWKHGSEYNVEVVVTRLYWTDASVALPEPRRRFPW